MKRMALLFALFAIGCGSKKVLTGYRKVLDEAETYELYSLSPKARIEASEKEEEFKGEFFHRWPVLGKISIKPGKIRDRLNEALFEGLDQSPLPARCFNPRHGIRATQGGETVELLICFECSRVQVFVDGQRSNETISDWPQAVFDDILHDAGVKLDKK